MAKLIDLTGQRFGRLTVVSRANNKGKHTCWHCLCDCGKETNTRASDLRSGKASSCGCMAKEKMLAIRTTHGGYNTRLHRIWIGIKRRTTNENTKAYKWYGERDIYVCAEWLNSFQSFREWALQNGYNDSLTIDRINNDKGYSPNNCRWVDMKTQARNRNNNYIIEYNGEMKILAEWSTIFNIHASTITQRLKNGWSVEKALTTPPGKNGKKKSDR